MKMQTKLFVNQLERDKANRVVEKAAAPKVQSKGSPTGMLTDAVIAVAPDLIEEAFSQFSSVMQAWSQEYVQTTYLHKNIDGSDDEEIFLPHYLRILRGDFSATPPLCQDGFSIDEKPDTPALLIDIETKLSEDQKSFYFQPLCYRYNGRDITRARIDEIRLSYAFVHASDKTIEHDQMAFTRVLSFADLNRDQEYAFLDNGIYDTTYQSPWISKELTKKGPYTIVFKIDEIQHRSKFRQSLHKIYKNHESKLQEKINKDIQTQLEKLKSNTNGVK